VYPLHYSPSREAINGYNFYQSDSQWVDDKLQLQRRYLAAREHRQFITMRSTRSQARLEVRPTKDALQVKNRLGVPIDIAFVFDEEGDLHSVENLAPDGVAVAQPVTATVARGLWESRVKPLVATVSYDPNRYDTMFTRNRYYGYYGRNQSQWSATQSLGELDRGLQDFSDVLKRMSQGANNATVGSAHSFVAITTEAVKADDGESMAPVGVRGSRAVDSLHVVRGTW
jgi:hypothetical protein